MELIQFHSEKADIFDIFHNENPFQYNVNRKIAIKSAFLY